MNMTRKEVVRWFRGVWLIEEGKVGVILSAEAKLPDLLQQVQVRVDSPTAGNGRMFDLKRLAKRDEAGETVVEQVNGRSVLILEYPPHLPVHLGDRVGFTVNDWGRMIYEGRGFLLCANARFAVSSEQETEEGPSPVPPKTDPPPEDAKASTRPPLPASNMVCQPNQLLKHNFQYRMMLKNLVRLRKLTEADVEKIFQVFEKAGARFPVIDPATRGELEESLAKILAVTNPKEREAIVLRFRARFSRSHELAVSHINIDGYSTDLPTERKTTVALVHAFLMSQAEGKTSDFNREEE